MNSLNDYLLSKSSISLRQIFIIVVCFFLNVVDGFDITMIAVTIGDIGKALDLVEKEQGIIFSFALAGMMVGAMLVAPVSDIWGRRKILLCALIVICVSVLFTPMSTNIETLALLRFSSGLGGGALLATQASLVSEYAPNRLKTLCVTLVTAGYPIGAMFTGLVAEHVIPNYGWQVMFYLGGVVTAVLLLFTIIYVPESVEYLINKQPENALVRINAVLKVLGKLALEKLPERSVNPNTSVHGNIHALFTVNRFRSTVMLWIIFCCCSSTLYFLMSWIPKLATQLGFELSISYEAFTYFSLGGVIGILTLGWLSSRISVTKLVSSFLGVAVVTMIGLATIANNPFTFLLLVSLTGLSIQSGYNALYAIATRLYPTNIRSTGVGWALGVGRLGAVIAPAVGGVMLSNGISASINILVFALPVLLSSICVFFLKVE